jgi:hypothetical protein
MPAPNASLREEFRERERNRITASPTLAEKFPELKSLTVELSHYSAGGVYKTSEVKYSVNLAHAKSVFCFECPNDQCVEGDFDLSDVLTDAVAARVDTRSGEACCQGWKSKTTIGGLGCSNVLRYTLNLEF